jgi:hypothetical protein
MTFKMRLSDGGSFSVEFHPENETQFGRMLWTSFMTYKKHNKTNLNPELQLQTNIENIYISPNYPYSNDPVILKIFPHKKTISTLWSKSMKAVACGDLFDQEIRDLVRFFISNELPVNLKVVKE